MITRESKREWLENLGTIARWILLFWAAAIFCIVATLPFWLPMVLINGVCS
jgi:hypothetical protein